MPSVHSMEYPANMLDPTKSSDEKNSFEEDVGIPTTGTGGRTTTSAASVTRFISEKLLDWGVEERGIRPVAVEDRTEMHFIKILFLWLSASMNTSSFASGTLGPVTFGLGLRDSCLVIVFFNLICGVPPAYLTTWGPKLGLRQLCSSRYTFGYYGAAVPSLLSIVSAVGFSVVNSILGGQSLSSIANISWTVGIVIISVISLFVSFCGIRVLNWYQNCAWFFFFLVFVVVAGVGGEHFVDTPVAPATVVQVFSFGAAIAGNMITWAPISSDYTAYFHPRVSSWRVSIYSYIGLTIPTIALQCLGAAAAISAPSVPEWNAGYTDGNVGGLINAMLSPVGGFGKFLMVLLSLSVTGANTPTLYSMCMELQVLIPPLVVVPRYVFSVVATVVITVLSIAGQHELYSAFSDFLGIIGYWAATWLSAILVEHFYFRKGNFALYDIQFWNVPSQLPLGAAALGSCILSFALVIPSMDQVLYTGPIARKTGDIGFEVAMVVTALLYVPLRHLEKRWRGV